MGGVCHELPLPLPVFRKGARGALGEYQQQKEYDPRAEHKNRRHYAEHRIGGLQLHEAVNNDQRISAGFIFKSSEAILPDIALGRPFGNDLFDRGNNGLPVQRGNVLKIDRADGILRRQARNEIAGLKRRFRRDLKACVGGGACVAVRHRKFAIILIEDVDGLVCPACGNAVIPDADGCAENRHGPQQRQHGDGDEFFPQRSDHAISSNKYPCPRRAAMRTLDPTISSFRRR